MSDDAFIPSLARLINDFLARPDYKPLNKNELLRALRLGSDQARHLRAALRDLEAQGAIVRLRKNRWAPAARTALSRGVLHVTDRGWGLVRLEESEDSVRIEGDALFNVIHGDTVQVEIRRDSAQRAPARPGRSGGRRYDGRIVRVLERQHPTVVGRLVRHPHYWYAIPDDPHFKQNVRLAAVNPVEPLEDHMGVVRLDDWDPHAPGLAGQLVEILGRIDQAGVDVLCLLKQHQYDHRYPPAVLREAGAIKAGVQPGDLDGRKDLRENLAFTIDPEDAKDFDDAVSLARDTDGTWRLGIHIADVSHYVTPDSALDREARRRGNTVYLVDRTLTMLPPGLTTGVCSLVPGEDRLTHSVSLRLAPDGRVLESETFPSVIRSGARLDYDRVQSLIDGRPPGSIPEPVRRTLADMNELAAILRRRRVRDGSIDFALPEVRCRLGPGGEPLEFYKVQSPDAYHLIEEFMLLANLTVAAKIREAGVASLYRIHEPPDEETWGELQGQLAELGFEAPPPDSSEIQKFVHSIRRLPLHDTVMMLLLRSMKRAVYSEQAAPHFGLAFDLYTHFTSPIRRYPDLVVHRVLKAVEIRRKAPYGATQMKAVGIHCSETEREADDAEQESLELKRIDFYARRLENGDTGPHPGLVAGIVPKGLIVELRDSLQRGLLPFAALNDDYYEMAENRLSATGRRRRRRWTLGDELLVDISRVDRFRKRLDFQLSEEEAAGSRPRKRRRDHSAR